MNAWLMIVIHLLFLLLLLKANKNKQKETKKNKFMLKQNSYKNNDFLGITI